MTDEPVIKGRLWALCAATLFQFIALGMFLVTIPVLVTDEFDGSRSAVGLAVGSFAITALLARPWVGRQLDRKGRKPFLLMSPLVLVVSAIGLANAPALWAVVALRLFQGLSAAGFYTGAASMATDIAGPDHRARAIARLSIFLYGGFTIGPNVAEYLIEGPGLAWAWAAAAISAATAASIVLTLTETLPAPVANDDRPPSPLVHPAALGPGFVLLGVAVGYTSVTSFSKRFATEIGMESAGALFAAFSITILGVRLFSGRLADRYGRFRVAMPGILTGAVGLGILATVPGPGLAMVGVGLYGAGFALVFPALMALAADRAPENERGAALGTFTAFFDVATATSGAIIGAIADVDGWGPAWATTAVLCLASAVLLVRLHVREGGEGRADDTPLPEPAGT